MKYEVDIDLSEQARLLTENSKVDEKKLIEWFINKRKIFVGGGDIVSYLKYKKDNGE